MEENSLSLTDCSVVLEAWKEFNLDEKKDSLESTCNSMREMKQASINGRKGLNDLTKSFRSRSKEEQAESLTDVLKAYQVEIDQLSRRSKASEGAFYNLFKSLQDLPNPIVAMESLMKMVTSTSAHQFEVERLKNEISQYEEEFQQLKNQDITIRRLEDQLLEYQEQIEDKVAEEVAQRSLEIEQQTEIRIAEIKDLQRVAERKTAAALETMRQAQVIADRAQSQLYEVSMNAEERIGALLAENSILAEGAERSHSRIAELEGELEVAKTALASATRAPTSTQHSETPSLSGGVLSEESQTLSRVVADLRQELRTKDELTRLERIKLETALRDVNLLFNKEKDMHAKLKQEIAGRPSVQDLNEARRQLRLLQKLVFNAGNEDDEVSLVPDPENTAGDFVQLEAVLCGRIKQLDAELTELRKKIQEAEAQQLKDKEAIQSLKKAVETANALIVRLENDLESQTGKTTRFESTNSKAVSSHLPKQLPRPHSHGNNSYENSEVLAAGSVELSVLLGVNMNMGNERPREDHLTSATNSTSMVDILSAQRDRYKERLAQVEAVVASLQHQVQAGITAKSELEADNLVLYGKIRYLQTYGSNQKGNISTSSRTQAYPVDEVTMKSMRTGVPNVNRIGSKPREEDIGDDVENRYSALYEQRMNPFVEFSQHERQRKVQELTVGDRIVLNTALAVISSQAGRRFLMIYLGTMHLLVFFILYYNAHYVHFGCDPALDQHPAGY